MRKRPHMFGLWLDDKERSMLDALAEHEHLDGCSLLRSLIVRDYRKKLGVEPPKKKRAR